MESGDSKTFESLTALLCSKFQIVLWTSLALALSLLIFPSNPASAIPTSNKVVSKITAIPETGSVETLGSMTGSTGSAGSVGSTGAAGSTGSTGSQIGETGSTTGDATGAETGSEGSEGTEGDEEGTSGTIGATSGTSGVIGFSGATGYLGVLGYSGVIGTGGTSGTSGSSGTLGYAGFSGSGGAGGSSGSSGGGGGGGTGGTAGGGGTGGGGGNQAYLMRCDERNGEFVDVFLSIPNVGQIPSNILYSEVTIKAACFCWKVDGQPGCRVCTVNDPTCAASFSRIRNIIANSDQAQIRDVRYVSFASSRTVIRSEPYIKVFSLSWDTNNQVDNPYFVMGEVDSGTQRFFSLPPLRVEVNNHGGGGGSGGSGGSSGAGGTGGSSGTGGSGGASGSAGGGGTGGTSGDVGSAGSGGGGSSGSGGTGGSGGGNGGITCKNVEVTLHSADVSFMPEDHVTNEEICFDYSTRELKSKNCLNTTCQAFRNPPTNDDILALVGTSVNPALFICQVVGGGPETVSFNWTVDGEVVPINISRCVFDEDRSFFGTQFYFDSAVRKAHRDFGIPFQDSPGIEVPPEGDYCPDNPDACYFPICPFGTQRYKDCYFLAPRPDCVTADENYNHCKVILNTSEMSFPLGVNVSRFKDRSYPSGGDLPAQCWGDVYVGCRGQPTMPVRYEEPDLSNDPDCLAAVTNRDRNACIQCRYKCLYGEEDGCYSSEGPCLNEYLGFGPNCGACDFRCQRTYEGCINP